MIMTAPTIAVLDANGIIGLAKAGCFPLLRHLFTEVCAPSPVVAEITDTISQSALQNALGKWVTEMNPSASSLARVAFIRQEGDRHVLALALDHQTSTPDCFLITGDEKLRRRAQKFGLASIDAPHLIQLFAEANLITAAKPHLDQMRQQGFGITQQDYEDILRRLGE
jgi:predicted nucleic acid-binding protein